MCDRGVIQERGMCHRGMVLNINLLSAWCDRVILDGGKRVYVEGGEEAGSAKKKRKRIASLPFLYEMDGGYSMPGF